MSDDFVMIERRLSEFADKLDTRFTNLSDSINAGYKELSDKLTEHMKSNTEEVHNIDTNEKLLKQKVDSNKEDIDNIGTKLATLQQDSVSKKVIYSVCVIIPTFLIVGIEVIKLVKG